MPEFDPQGNVASVLAVGHDITRRKGTDDTLGEREILYRAIVTQAPDAVVMTDAETLRFYEFNDIACQGLGYSREEFSNLTVIDINADLSKEDHLRRCSEILEEGYAVFETLHRHRDGSLRNVRVSLRRVDLRGRTYFIGFWTDITTQCRLGRELRETYQRLDSLFSFLPDATFAVDTQGKVIAWNKAMEKLTGVQADQILGKGNRDYSVAFYGEVRPMLVDIVLTGYEGSEWYESMQKEVSNLSAPCVRIERVDGRVNYFSAVAAPLFDSEERVIGIIEQIRDISGIQHAETERKRLVEQLHQARKMEAIGQLAGGIAHDFNNILSAIIGYAEIVKIKLGYDSPLNPFLDKILFSADRAAGLTRDLLAFSRKQVIEYKPTDLGRTITVYHQFISRLLREDIELSVSFPDKPLVVMAGETPLTQILMNLSANAQDAMPIGGKITMTASSFIMDRQFVERYGYGSVGAYALLTFADTGCGHRMRNG